MKAYEILKNRGVNRLCHFTKLNSFIHIIAEGEGIVSTDALKPDLKKINDTERYDGRTNYVCCSIQYPNSWYLKKVINRDNDKIFKEWVILYVDLRILKNREAAFCPCNASREYGRYINENIGEINSIFNDDVLGRKRTSRMMACCPTDDQAEILIKNNIPREYIMGVAVGDEEMANRILAMYKTLKISPVPVYIAPDVVNGNWSQMIRAGISPKETILCEEADE